MDKWRETLLILWKRYERHISMGGLLAGFLFDLWLAKRPDSTADNLLIVLYLCIAAGLIVVLNMRTLRRQMERDHPSEPLFLLFLLQFCFGGLASNFIILYGKSGTLGGSMLFVVLLVALAFGNEFQKERYQQLRFNVAVYYFLLLTYCVIAVPTYILHTVGATVFLVSVALSLGLITCFLWGLFKWVFRKQEKWQMVEVSAIVGGICLVFMLLYFTHIIPPVPLSLKQIGIYHTLQKNDHGGYFATYEKPAWYVFWRDTDSKYTYAPASEAYCFSAVFAPGKLSAPIVHQWEKYNDKTRKWELVSKFSFPINGGRDGGYRGWSAKVLSPGRWRCDIETARGQLIGRISFSALEGGGANLSTITL